MFALILMTLFGLGVAYFATQNTNTITLHMAHYYSSIPLYAVVVGSILLGIFISWLISLVNAISTSLELRGKNSALKNSARAIDRLEERVHELEVENASLKGVSDEPVVEEERVHETRPGFFSSLRHRFAA